MKSWNGLDLQDYWLITRKIDGVQAIVTSEKVVSRANKPLYNLEWLKDAPGTYEIFRKDWATSVSLVRSQSPTDACRQDAYCLNPIDKRLIYGVYHHPKAIRINALMDDAISEGYEGLVLHSHNGWDPLKVKPKASYDVLVTGMIEGEGKHKGRLGAFMTPMGKVGTGFTDQERQYFWNSKDPIGTIEVECMGLTPAGKFRHPRFIRVRFDK